MPSSELSDIELVQKCLKDPEVFGELIDRYEGKLIRYIQRISAYRSDEAEEILQEVFLKAWKNLNDFDTKLSFSSWIYRITHNETISQFRKTKSRGENKLIPLDEQVFQVIANDMEIGEIIDQKERNQQVTRCISMLSPNHQEVLILKYLEDKSYEEISDILQKPMGTVATLLNRAKKAFKTSYKNTLRSV